MRAFLVASLYILLAPIAAGGAGGAGPTPGLLPQGGGAKPPAAGPHPPNENEAGPHRRSAAATPEGAGCLDRGIANQRREMREMVAESGSEARRQAFQAADTVPQALQAADTASQAFQAADTVPQAFQAADTASQAFQAADTASQAFQAADTASQAFQETREQVREAIQDARAQAREAREAAKARVREAIQDARAQAKEARAQAKEAIQEAKAQVRDALREAEAQARGANALAKDAGADAALAQARRLRMQGKYDEAAKAYQKFIAENPDSSRLFEARFWLAKCRLSGQKWDEAAEAFTDFLKRHSDQRAYSQQAKEDRIYCWKMRLGKNPKAAPGLKAALNDPDTDIRVQAALALAEGKDASGRAALEESLDHPRLGEQCGLALWKLGLRDKPKAGESPSPWAKMLVIKVKCADPNDSFEMRVPVHFFKGVEKMLPEEARDEMARKGVGNITDLAATAPKGQVLFQFRGDNGRTSVVISVD